MPKKRLIVGILFLLLSLVVIGIYIWGLLLANAVEDMFAYNDVTPTKSNNLFAQLAPLGAAISGAIALWLLLGPLTQRLLSKIRGDRRNR